MTFCSCFPAVLCTFSAIFFIYKFDYLRLNSFYQEYTFISKKIRIFIGSSFHAWLKSNRKSIRVCPISFFYWKVNFLDFEENIFLKVYYQFLHFARILCHLFRIESCFSSKVFCMNLQIRHFYLSYLKQMKGKSHCSKFFIKLPKSYLANVWV